MSFTVTDASQFRVKEIVLITKGGPVDLTPIYEELNLFDSLFLPIISGNIMITDAIGLSDKLNFDGSEVIALNIEKSADSEIAAFKKSYRIYKQSDRRNVNQSSESYVLHFVSDELIFSDQQRVNQSYETTYSKIVQKILDSYLKVGEKNKAVLEDSTGIKKVVIPNMRPLEAIEWCAKRAIDSRNSPNFVFFCNNIGYNFVSLSTLLKLKPLLDINFEPKNLESKNSLEEISSAKSFEVLVQNDAIDKTRSGVNAGKFIGFDPMTRTFGEKRIDLDSHYSAMSHGNKGSNSTEIHNRDGTSNFTTFDSRKVVSIFGPTRKNSNYIKKNDPESISKIEDYENFAFQRKAILKNLMAKRLKIVMPGNFQLTSGFNINFKASGFNVKSKADDNDDTSVSGKYLIVATRHIITNNKHETIIEVATDSTNDNQRYVSNPQQNQVIGSYS
jgi:hypothetical protein